MPFGSKNYSRKKRIATEKTKEMKSTEKASLSLALCPRQHQHQSSRTISQLSSRRKQKDSGSQFMRRCRLSSPFPVYISPMNPSLRDYLLLLFLLRLSGSRDEYPFATSSIPDCKRRSIDRVKLLYTVMLCVLCSIVVGFFSGKFFQLSWLVHVRNAIVIYKKHSFIFGLVYIYNCGEIGQISLLITPFKTTIIVLLSITPCSECTLPIHVRERSI